ncbi:MAG: hypothetical protein IIZ39_02940, partial [Blautia sp.]|nr:hypothetical protein [Blautia sp.]
GAEPPPFFHSPSQEAVRTPPFYPSPSQEVVRTLPFFSSHAFLLPFVLFFVTFASEVPFLFPAAIQNDRSIFLSLETNVYFDKKALYSLRKTVKIIDIYSIRPYPVFTK